MMPSLIAQGASFGESGQWFARGGWATGTALYVVATAAVVRSPDGSTWTVCDQANQPSTFDIFEPYSSWLHTDGYLYVLYNSAVFTVRIRRFNTATDTWETSDYTGVDVSTAISDQASARIVVCPNNELVCFYQDVNTLAPTIRRWDGASWGAETSLEATDGRPLDMIVDGSDRLVLAWEDATNHTQKYVTIDNLGVIGSIDTFDTSVNTTPTVSSMMTRFNDGTNDLIALLSRDTGGEIDCQYGVEGSTLGSLTTVDAIASDPSISGNSLALASFGGQLYAIWHQPNTMYYAVSTSLSPLAFDPPVQTQIVTFGFNPNPQWIVGLNAIGILFRDSGQDTISVEWLVQPDGYQPWPANDISQLVTASTRE